MTSRLLTRTQMTRGSAQPRAVSPSPARGPSAKISFTGREPGSQRNTCTDTSENTALVGQVRDGYRRGTCCPLVAPEVASALFHFLRMRGKILTCANEIVQSPRMRPPSRENKSPPSLTVLPKVTKEKLKSWTCHLDPQETGSGQMSRQKKNRRTKTRIGDMPGAVKFFTIKLTVTENGNKNI